MAQAMIRVPGFVFRGLLKVLSATMTFVLVLFCYATGQIPKSPAASTDRQPASLLSTLRGAVPALSDITPDYGIGPLYGVVEYGVPYADYTVKGTIRQQAGGEPIAGIQVALRDTSSGTVIVSDTTDAQGAFSLEIAGTLPMLNTWTLRAQDVDGILNGGAFAAKDTVITIPADSLKGGTGFYAGSGEATVELRLTEASSRVIEPAEQTPVEASMLSVALKYPLSAEVQFSLAQAGRVRLRAYDAAGALVADLFDRDLAGGSQVLPVNVSGLRSGACFFRLDVNGTSRVTKVMLP